MIDSMVDSMRTGCLVHCFYHPQHRPKSKDRRPLDRRGQGRKLGLFPLSCKLWCQCKSFCLFAFLLNYRLECAETQVTYIVIPYQAPKPKPSLIHITKFSFDKKLEIYTLETKHYYLFTSLGNPLLAPLVHNLLLCALQLIPHHLREELVVKVRRIVVVDVVVAVCKLKHADLGG